MYSHIPYDAIPVGIIWSGTKPGLEQKQKARTKPNPTL
jgi:hypothetical protein